MYQILDHHRILLCTYLNGDIGWWRFCSNVEHKQRNSEAHQNSPTHLQPNPSTRIRVAVREEPLPPSFSLPIIVLIKRPFLHILILISLVVTTAIDDNETINVSVLGGGGVTPVVGDLLVVQEGVAGATGGGVAAEGEARGFVLFVGRV